MFERFMTDMKVALLSGNPPIYLQLMLLTMVFIMVRIYVLVRMHKRQAEPWLNALTVTYSVLLVLLGIGTWEAMHDFYRVHGHRVITAIERLV